MRPFIFFLFSFLLFCSCHQDSQTNKTDEANSPIQEQIVHDEEELSYSPPPPPPPPAPAPAEKGISIQSEAEYSIIQQPEPVQHNTEDYSAIQENSFKRVLDAPITTFSIDVDRASYSNVRRFLNNGSLPPIDAVRIEEFINYFDYEYQQPKDKHPFHVQTTLTESPWNSGLQLAHIALQGKKIDTENLPPSNLVFLIDVSGSMSSPNKLNLLQAGFNLLVDQLRDEDQISIVVYAGSAGQVLEPTKGSEKAKIKMAMNQLQAGGSTAGGEGIKLAYKIASEYFIEEGNNRVILATDGDFNVGVSSDAELQRLIEKERESGVFLSVLGFGMGNYKDNKMETLADKGNGNYAYIDNIMEAKKVFVNEFGGTLFTIAKDVKLQVEFNPATVEAYRLIGYENRALQNEDFNDDKKDAGELGSGHTVTAIYEIVPKGIDSEYLRDIDDLKYQQNENDFPKNNSDIFTVKLRYKLPDSSVSTLTETVLKKNEEEPFQRIDEDIRFSIAVAELGLLLRNSEFKGNADYANVIKTAQDSKGKDEEGYRAEFIQLVKTEQLLDQRNNDQVRMD